MALQLDRNFVEDVIYGWSRSRRLLQDDPVRPDVWIAYAMNLAEPQNLLLEPLFGVRPGEVAVRLRRVLQAENILQETRPIYNQSTVAIRLTFEQLVTYVLPWTRWWCECLLEHIRAGGSMLAVTEIKNLHDDLAALYEGRKARDPGRETPARGGPALIACWRPIQPERTKRFWRHWRWP